MRLMWRISVIEFGERSNSVLAEVGIEAFRQPLRLLQEGCALDPEGCLYIRLQKERPRTTLMVCEIPVDLCSFVNSLLLDIPRSEGPDSPCGKEFVVHDPEDRRMEFPIHR